MDQWANKGNVVTWVWSGHKVLLVSLDRKEKSVCKGLKDLLVVEDRLELQECQVELGIREHEETLVYKAQREPLVLSAHLA